MTLGGRAAEKVVFGKISTGAQNDLDQVTKMAYSMVAIYGMNDEVGNVSFYGMQQDQFQKPYSDETASKIDHEVREMIDVQYDRAQELLTEKRKELEILAQALLKDEVILKSDVERLIGPSVHPDNNSAPDTEVAAEEAAPVENKEEDAAAPSSESSETEPETEA